MDKEQKILLAEDEETLGMILSEHLQAKGYDTTLTTNGEDAYNTFVSGKFDICIFDVMMPKKDGFTLAKEIRMLDTEVPIVFLTAKTMKDDILQGFKVGADDYLSKPFSTEELLLRIEAILRRTSGATVVQETYVLGKYKFDTQKQQLSLGDGEPIKLTTKESELLKLLCLNANKVLERNIALKTIWVDDNYFNARSMDVYITKLRKHLKDDPTVEIINVHGKGYKLVM
ncbi:MAG: response regulator transcription factor [Bacteroidales bacterium]|nr:response regulator transcription factor [Bacteroidales bacterium]